MVRHAVKTLNDGEVRALVAGWRQQMVDKDAAVRRRIEVGLEPFGLDHYESNCTAVADLLGGLMDSLAPAMPQQPTSASHRERERAFADATRCATETPTDDFVPLMAAEEFTKLDDLSQRSLLLAWLPAAERLYVQKARASHRVGSRLTNAAPMVAAAPSSPALSPREASPLITAWHAYLEHMAETNKAWRKKPAGKAGLAGQAFVGLIGHDKPIGAVTREDFDRYEWFINHRPPRCNGTNADEDLLALERSLKAANAVTTTRLGKRTVNEYFQRVVRFFDWAKDKGYIKEHYAAGMTYKLGEDGEDGSKERLPWTDGEIRAMLDPANLRKFIDRRTSTAHDKQRLTYLPWFLLLVCYTGARRTEIAGLTVDDVLVQKEVGGVVPVILIRKNDVRPNLKNAAAERSVPIHPHLLDLGLMRLVENRRRGGHRRLLWNLESGGNVGTKISNDFAAYVKAIGLGDPEGRKVLHSFRHSFKTKADGHMPSSVVDSIVGHQRNDSTGGRYVHYLDMPRSEHRVALSKLDFGLDLSGLKTVLVDSTEDGIAKKKRR
jgi:integrase